MKKFYAAALTLFLVLMANITAAAVPFPMPDGYFVKAKMPMHVVFPRPDLETQVHARHRWAHPQMTYEIPIGVQGGAWPFKYELVKAPAGADIGSLYGDENYGSISWAPSKSSGVEEFVVRITDQDLNTIEASWKVTIDPKMFVFIKAGATGAKTGTITDPLASFAEWYKNPKDSTYHNKIVVLREGAYHLVSDPAETGNMRLHESYKTPSLIAFPGEEVVFDTPNAKIMVDRLLDMFIAGITWRNARNDLANAHFFWLTGDVSRATFWRNTFKEIKYGSRGDDNTGPVFISSTPKVKENILFKENLLESVHNAAGNGTYLTIYRSSYVLIEQNTVRNSSTNTGWHAKATVGFVSIRANMSYENVRGTQIGLGYGAATGEVPHDHEICWNKIAVPESQEEPALLAAVNDYYKGQSYNTYIYRNTIVNGTSVLRYAGKAPFETDGNFIVTKRPALWPLLEMKTFVPNVVSSPTSGKLTSALSIMGSEFGRAGSDVAVKPAPLAPVNPKISN
jgi:hypothetical protein